MRDGYIKNSYTGHVYSDEKLYVGVPEHEKQFYRVMPIDGEKKLFFNSKQEYKLWFHKQFQVRPVRKMLGIQSI